MGTGRYGKAREVVFEQMNIHTYIYYIIEDCVMLCIQLKFIVNIRLDSNNFCLKNKSEGRMFGVVPCALWFPFVKLSFFPRYYSYLYAPNQVDKDTRIRLT